ncbi:MAG: CmpA/NrtA family ABC transporter substrate-binding protein [Hyphomicrobium sp.]
MILAKSAAVVDCGFIPLLDAAPLVIAKELGLDRRNGFTMQLHRESSWANIRDKVDLGIFDCAHMLAPMPLAATLGLGRPMHPVIAPMVLSLNGNAITVSNTVYDEMRAADVVATEAGGLRSASALKKVVSQRQADGRELLTLGMVYPFSAHNYDLRCWLAAAGIHPDSDLNLVVVPPSLLSASLKAGKVDGFCVGSPWNSVSVMDGDGIIIALKEDLWPASPEKVLGVREGWAEESRDRLLALIAALRAACAWISESANHAEAASILARPHYVGVDRKILEDLLNGRVELGRARARQDTNMVLFSAGDANRPQTAHAIWFLTQMIRWGQARTPFSIRAVAERVYRDDLFEEAVTAAGPQDEGRAMALHRAQFFQGEAFNADDPLTYLGRTHIKTDALDLAGFRRVNA